MSDAAEKFIKKAEKSRHQKSVDFLTQLFLVCPECSKYGYLSKVSGDNIIIKCECTKWKISFKIKEY